MRIKIQGFLAQNHSWAHVLQNMARPLINLGHQVEIFSTNGSKHFPSDLKPQLLGFTAEHSQGKIEGQAPSGIYDLQLTYTVPPNFSRYLAHGSKNRFGIWNYETTVLPPGFAKYYTQLDLLLPSSNFSRGIFLKNGIPESKLRVLKHGVDAQQFRPDGPKYPLKSSKAVNILVNIAQPHLRKNLPGIFTAYGRAFNHTDDVCLVCKVVDKKPQHSFEVNFREIYQQFQKQFPQHAEVEVITDFLPDMANLYRACDIVFGLSHTECFWLPGLEGLAAEKIVLAPRYGGQLDFMNDDNSLLIEGKVVQAPKALQYWSASPYAEMFQPDLDDAVEKLKQAVWHYTTLHRTILPKIRQKIAQSSWEAVISDLISLPE